MRRWVFPSSLMGLAFAVLFAVLPPRPAAPEGEDPDEGDRLQVFFIGHRNSQIEPCGCKVKQLGGVQHEATLYEQESRGAGLRVDVGGFAATRTTPENSMRTRYVLSAMAGGLDFDAINVGRSDLDLGAKFFESAIETTPEIADILVSANVFVRPSPDRRAFHAYRNIEKTLTSGETIRIFVTGVTSVRGVFSNFNAGSPPHPPDDFLIRPPAEALRDILTSAGREADLRVALVHAPWEETLEIIRANPEIDIAVVAAQAPVARRNRRAGDGRVGDGAEDDARAGDADHAAGNAWILAVRNSEGKVLGLAEFVRPNDGDVEGDWELPGDPRWIDIGIDIPEARDMVALIEDYKASTSELMIRKPLRPRRTFAGALSCRTCHLEQFNDWAETRHARALQTLVDKGMQFSSNCLQCHTLGFARDNGFYNVKESMAMANVQCESCHSAASEHVDTQHFLVNRSFESISENERAYHLRRATAALPPAAVAEARCIACHTPENDDHFVYDAKTSLIDHK